MTSLKVDQLIDIAQQARADCVHSPKGDICPGCVVTAMQRAITIERNRVLGDPGIEKVQNWIYSYQLRHLRKAIKYAETGIEQAIMDEDGMDGAEGEDLLKLIRGMASIKEAEAELGLKSLIARAEELCQVALDPQVPEASKKTAVEALKRALALSLVEDDKIEVARLFEVHGLLNGCEFPSNPCAEKEKDPDAGHVSDCRICKARAMIESIVNAARKPSR